MRIPDPSRRHEPGHPEAMLVLSVAAGLFTGIALGALFERGPLTCALLGYFGVLGGVVFAAWVEEL